MAFEIRLPALGEGITDAALVRWLVNEGDSVTKDSPIAEIATDKVDTEILSPADGIIEKIIFQENSVVKIGEIIALLNVGNDASTATSNLEIHVKGDTPTFKEPVLGETFIPNKFSKEIAFAPVNGFSGGAKKYISPFVRNLAYSEGIAVGELNSINGTGQEGRITRDDILSYLLTRKVEKINPQTQIVVPQPKETTKPVNTDNEEYVELDRVRKMIAENMLRSKQIAPHVSSFVEVNVTKIVNWRNRHKDQFKKKYGNNLTYMPVFVEAVARTLKDFPYINASLTDDYLVVKKQINIGVATALPDGNLVVPVVKNVGDMNILAISQAISDLTNRARIQKLQLSEIKDGTFTVTNAGSFGNIGGTPIIKQPELAILAVGAIVKKPVAIKSGDSYGIAVQDMVELWLSYDHRVVDGSLGGSFLKRIAEYLEQFDDTTSV